MESYPSELLVGVFPLVFCVDASVKAISNSALSGGSTGMENSDNQDNDEQTGVKVPPHGMSLSSRSQFDRLLDAFAAASVEDRGMQDSHPLSNANNRPRRNSEGRLRRKPEDVMRSLFRADDESGDDSDLDDDVVLNSNPISPIAAATARPQPTGYDSNGNPVYDKSRQQQMQSMTTPIRRSFRAAPSLGRNFRLGNRSSRNLSPSPSPTPTNATSTSPLSDTSFANTLGEGQHFFQRARMVPISNRHGFPPSKDPDGTNNRINYFVEDIGVPTNPRKLLSAMADNPLDGILPSGWLVKHSHALPSVLLVVVPVSFNLSSGGDIDPEDPENPPSVDTSVQAEQDNYLMKTLEDLHISLAAKRKCQIFIVGIVQEGTSLIQAEQWSQTMSEQLRSGEHENIQITMLNAEDISDPDQLPNNALIRLHTSIRDASLNYYMSQARRTKRKLVQLGESRYSFLVLPLTIRYFFKIAVWYEFQWRHEKSIRYMVEAYHYAQRYYRYLVQYSSGEVPADGGYPLFDDPVPHRPSISSPGEGFELSFGGSGYTNDDPIEPPPPPPEDMMYQCRTIADWLNFKILNACLVSRTESGLWAGSAQWQRHTRVFCSQRKFLVSSILSAAAEAENKLNREKEDGEEKSIQVSAFAGASWYDWSFVARQRLVVSQLLERYPPRGMSEATAEEIAMRCSPWRNYQATADTLLRLGVEVQRAVRKQEELIIGSSVQSGEADSEANAEKKTRDSLRAPYVGSLDSDDIITYLKDEIRNDHKEKALDCILRAVSLFEQEAEKAKSELAYLEGSWSRSGARIYYIAGGILLGMGRHKEATPHLEKAVSHAEGWNQLELAIRRMLIECYARHVPSETTSGPSDSREHIASMILDSYFNAEMSNSNLRRALENLSRVGAIQWHRSCIDEAESSLPFSFALTFPTSTHATAGDTVKANVLIKSNLDYAVHVNSVTLLSMAGKIDIPTNDMLSARNASVGTDGGIIIQANTEIWVTTHLDLPKDLNIIAIDDSGNGGQNLGVAGRGAFATSARPRSAGITSGGGARLLPEFDNAGGQWSTRYLGGKPLRCDGVLIKFNPVYISASSGGECKIELTIEKRLPKTAANIKRSPFEEDNYLTSAWSRPRRLPLSYGPRCLRVLPPMPGVIVTNLTELCTNGTVLEGTINRILLRLQAGEEESCGDVTMKVSCGSVLITLDGKTKKITAESPSDPEEAGANEDPRNPKVRTPVLVVEDNGAPSTTTEFGYPIPAGWSLLGDGQGGGTNPQRVVSSLKKNESTYAFFDVFRPSPPVTRMDGVLQVGEQEEDISYERLMCQTSIDVTITYKQERPAQQAQMIRAKRKSRKRTSAVSPPSGVPPSTPSQSEEESIPDLVTLEYSGSVVWNAPLAATFSPGIKHFCPSGNRHPSNSVPDASLGEIVNTSHDNEMVLIDGEQVTTRCTLEGAASAEGLNAVIESIKFEDKSDEQSPCTFSTRNEMIYNGNHDEDSRTLSLGTKFKTAWSSKVHMTQDYLKGSISAPLGAISVEWLPVPFTVPDDVTPGKTMVPVSVHGPLRLSQPPTCRFMGPPCYIENAPFDVQASEFPVSPSVAVPFPVSYAIRNKTEMSQKINVVLDSTDSDSVMISGIFNGTVSLGPGETRTLSYTVLPTRTGNMVMPKFFVSSERYKTWIVHEGEDTTRRLLLVQP